MATEAKANKKYSDLPPLPAEDINPAFLYSYQEAAPHLRMTWRQVRNRVERGELPYVDNGRRRLILGADIEKYKADHRVAPAVPRRRRRGGAR